MNNGGDATGEFGLAEAFFGVFGVMGEDGGEFIRGDEGEKFKIFFEGMVGLVEPKLVKIKNRGFGAVEPDSVTFGLAEFATGGFIEDKWAGISVSVGVFEVADEVDARCAVAELVGATELEVDAMGAIEMKEIVTLDEGIAEFGVGDAGAASANAFLDKLAVEELGHAEAFADFAEEGENFDIFEPVEIIEDFSVGCRVGDANDLSGERALIERKFVEGFEVAFGGVFGVANLASGAADKEVGLIAMTDKAGAHHKGGEVTDVKTVCGRVGAPVEAVRFFVEEFGVFDGALGDEAAPEEFFG